MWRPFSATWFPLGKASFDLGAGHLLRLISELTPLLSLQPVRFSRHVVQTRIAPRDLHFVITKVDALSLMENVRHTVLKEHEAHMALHSFVMQLETHGTRLLSIN